MLQFLRQLGCALSYLLCADGGSWDAQEQRGIHKSTHARDFEQVSIFGGSRSFDGGRVGLAAERRGLSVCSSSTEGR